LGGKKRGKREGAFLREQAKSGTFDSEGGGTLGGVDGRKEKMHNFLADQRTPESLLRISLNGGGEEVQLLHCSRREEAASDGVEFCDIKVGRTSKGEDSLSHSPIR